METNLEFNLKFKKNISETALAMANKILRTMENKRFNDFYNGKFETYLIESGQNVTKENVIEDIVRLFDLH